MLKKRSIKKLLKMGVEENFIHLTQPNIRKWYPYYSEEEKIEYIWNCWLSANFDYQQQQSMTQEYGWWNEIE